MDIIERAEAKAKGLNTYFTGRPCRNGHLTYRYTLSGSCSECINGDRHAPVDPTKPARREAKAQLVLLRVRAYDGDRDNIAAAAWALAVMRYPVLLPADIDPKLLPSDKTAGTALYAFYCHAEDVAQLREIAKAAMAQHQSDVAVRRAQLLGQVLQAANVDTSPPMSFK